MVLADNMILFLLGWEIMGLCSFLLIGALSWMSENDSQLVLAAFYFKLLVVEGVGEDLDGDGKTDIIVTEQRWEDDVTESGHVHLYRNRFESGNNWVGVRLEESGGGVQVHGARVVVKRAGGVEERSVWVGLGWW